MEEKIRLGTDPTFLKGAREAYDPVILGALIMNFEETILADAADAKRLAKYEGQRIGEIARAEGADLVDMMFRVIAESGVKAEFRGYMNVEGVEPLRPMWGHDRILMGGTDGGAHIKYTALGDHVTEILTYMVKESGIATLERAHNRMKPRRGRIYGHGAPRRATGRFCSRPDDLRL